MIAVSVTVYDRIDFDACLVSSIVVSNGRGCASNTIPKHTFALILSLRRGLKGYQSDVTEGKWQQSRQFCLFAQPVGDLHSPTLGLIGSGVIGMRVVRAARKGTGAVPAYYTLFDQVIEQSDVISLHCPLTPVTVSLIAALDSGSIAGAALHVVSVEEQQPDHIFLRYLERPNFILTPHVGWSSHDARQALWDKLIGYIGSVADGRP